MPQITKVYTGIVVGMSALFLVVWLATRPDPHPPAPAPTPPAPQACQSTISQMPIRNPDAKLDSTSLWQAPVFSATVSEEIQYGKRLIQYTSHYYGPNGSLQRGRTNGLNCQNCHLDAGTRPFGNNFSAVAATYPKFRARSGSVEDLDQRINDCFERSLNGQPPAPNSPERQAIKAYILWLGKDVPKGETPKGAGIARLPFLSRPANASRGSVVYMKRCATCHQADGQGLIDTFNNQYKYPPLWGPHSYNTAAGMYRLSHLAGFAKYNMPHGQADYRAPLISDDEAWDVAAYINSQPRPQKIYSKDFPDPSQKPPDHPFPPYADSFSQSQHKYGPFGPIKAACAKPNK